MTMDVCSICLEDIDPFNRNMTITGCGHKFHTDCLIEWAKYRHICPMCKENIGVKPEDEDIDVETGHRTPAVPLETAQVEIARTNKYVSELTLCLVLLYFLLLGSCGYILYLSIEMMINKCH